MGGKEGGRGDGCERALKGEGSGCEDQSLGLATPRLLTNGSVCRWAAQQRTLLSRCRCAPWLMCPARHFKGIRAHAIGTAEAVVLRDGAGRGEGWTLRRTLRARNSRAAPVTLRPDGAGHVPRRRAARRRAAPARGTRAAAAPPRAASGAGLRTPQSFSLNASIPLSS